MQMNKQLCALVAMLLLYACVAAGGEPARNIAPTRPL